MAKIYAGVCAVCALLNFWVAGMYFEAGSTLVGALWLVTGVIWSFAVVLWLRVVIGERDSER